jgi:hypothetical protein
MSWFRGHFDLPVTPDGTQMPQSTGVAWFGYLNGNCAGNLVLGGITALPSGVR